MARACIGVNITNGILCACLYAPLFALPAYRQHRVPVMLDAGGEDRPWSGEQAADVVCPNETELARLTGMPTGTHEEQLAAARALQGKGVKSVLVTVGADGAFLLG